MLTGDTGVRDEDGYFWFHGRNDDVIISGGYRIGPGEIEECLMAHPAVALVAAVGAPDQVRGEIVKAFIVPREGVTVNDALRADVQTSSSRGCRPMNIQDRSNFVRLADDHHGKNPPKGFPGRSERENIMTYTTLGIR